jgi:hypothetical protein
MKKSAENIDVLHDRAPQTAAAVERLSFMPHDGVVDSKHQPASVEGPPLRVLPTQTLKRIPRGSSRHGNWIFSRKPK